MEVFEHEPLRDKTTLRVGGTARFFIETDDIAAAASFAKEKSLPLFVLGGGSNIILPDTELDAVVLHLSNKGIEIDGDILEIGAGENLDEVIQKTVDMGYWGLENLSLIPGTVAGLAVQNVGAYGVEASSYIEYVRVFNIDTEEYEDISNKDCLFGYRSSIFNTTAKGRYIISSLTLKLSKEPNPILSYRDLQDFKENPTQQEIRDRVIEIRKGKDLDPERVWSVGSFFKNVEVESLEDFNLSEKVKNSVFKTEKGHKIPSAALIDSLGLKGFCVGDACISETQANMVVNKGSASTEQIQELFNLVQEKVEKETGVRLLNEPEFV